MKTLGLLTLPLLLLFSAGYGQSPAGLPVAFSTEADHIAVTIGGQPFTNFYTGDPYPKPCLHPLRAADGRVVTRAFPLAEVSGESHDHPHHRGLFIGLGDINGTNFWENEKTYKTTNRGTMVLTGEPVLNAGEHQGTIGANFSWRDLTGKEIMTERRVMTFSGTSAQRIIDFDITFNAIQDLHFGDTKEGFFAIRLADSMTEDKGGQMEASTGFTTEKGVRGRPADWVQYAGNVDHRPVSITIFDHPGNLNHPERWHARAYGLFAVNPFGLKEFDPYAKTAGGFNLRAGSTIRFRYRVLINDAPQTPDQLKAEYSAWAAKS